MKPANVIALIAGALFGVGLMVSGMTQPARIIHFLDVTRGWDPTLLFVMAGAVPVYGVTFRLWNKRQGCAWSGDQLAPGAKARIDRQLLPGAAIFGVGWGLGGYCPGPGTVTLGAGAPAGLVFVATMLVGMSLQHRTRGDA